MKKNWLIQSLYDFMYKYETYFESFVKIKCVPCLELQIL